MSSFVLKTFPNTSSHPHWRADVHWLCLPQHTHEYKCGFSHQYFVSTEVWRSISWPKAVNCLPHVVSLSTQEKQEVYVSGRHQRLVFHCDTVRTRTQQRVSCCHICQDSECISKGFFFERYIFIFFAAFHFVKLQLVNQILVFVTFIFCCCVLPTAAFLGFWFIDVFFLFCWHDVVYINILTSISWYIQFITVKVLGICEYLPPKKSSGTLRLKDKYVCYYERTIFVESR